MDDETYFFGTILASAEAVGHAAVSCSMNQPGDDLREGAPWKRLCDGSPLEAKSMASFIYTLASMTVFACEECARSYRAVYLYNRPPGMLGIDLPLHTVRIPPHLFDWDLVTLCPPQVIDRHFATSSRVRLRRGSISFERDSPERVWHSWVRETHPQYKLYRSRYEQLGCQKPNADS